MAARKSSRVGISSKGASTNNMGGSDAGTSAIPPNSFAILNTINDDDLASIEVNNQGTHHFKFATEKIMKIHSHGHPS